MSSGASGYWIRWRHLSTRNAWSWLHWTRHGSDETACGLRKPRGQREGNAVTMDETNGAPDVCEKCRSALAARLEGK